MVIFALAALGAAGLVRGAASATPGVMRGIETAQAVTGVMRVLGHLADAFVALAEWVGNVRRAPRAPVRANGDIGIATPTVPKPPIKPQPGQKTPATATEPLQANANTTPAITFPKVRIDIAP